MGNGLLKSPDHHDTIVDENEIVHLNQIVQASKAAMAEQASARSKAAKVSIQMIQNSILIWCDQTSRDTNADCKHTTIKLRNVINSLHKYTNKEECIQFLETIKDEKACIVVSGRLGQELVPLVYDMPQVDSIFIFCSNKEYHEGLAKGRPKIKGVQTDINLICKDLKKAAEQCEQDAMSIRFMGTGDVSTKNLNHLESTFMYTQILKEILLTIEFDSTHFKEFIDYCRGIMPENEDGLDVVEKLEKEYCMSRAIWWYSYNCFLYRMLNRAFWNIEPDKIIKLGFFIKDLHQHIEHLHREQYGGHDSSARFTVFRGQRMLEAEFKEMRKRKGGLQAFNGFFSTSKKRNVALSFVRNTPKNPGMIAVLFVIDINPTQSSTPFASIAEFSNFKGIEDEVLFSMHTVCRIGEIRPTVEDDQIFQVELTLTNDNDEDLRKLTDRIREETCPNEVGLLRLRLLLSKMGLSEKAEEVNQILKERTIAQNSNECEYDPLGLAKYNEGKYEEALGFYEKALKTYKTTLSSTDLRLANCYGRIGNAFSKMGDYLNARLSHEEALKIQSQSLPENHPDLGTSYNEIGDIYRNINDIQSAINNYEKALEIRKKSLLPYDPNLCTSYSNVGAMYNSIDIYEKALSNYEKVLEIQQRLPHLNNDDLYATHNIIAEIHDKMEEYPEALSSYESALEVLEKSSSVNGHDLSDAYSKIGNMYHKIGEYLQALSFYEKALENRQQSLPPNHPDLGNSLNNIGLEYYHMGEYEKALSTHEKALEIQQQSLPSNHLDLGTSYNNIGMAYFSMDNYEKAFSFYEQAFEIRQQSLPPKDPDLATSYYNIGTVYYKRGDYEKALSYEEKALEIRQESLRRNHPDFIASHSIIGEVHTNMGNHEKAAISHEKALEIQEQLLPPNHTDLCSSCGEIALAYVSMHDYSKARQYYERAVRISEQALPSDDPRRDEWRRKFEDIKELQ